MNDNRSEMYSINSGYYDLPVKEPWVCGKTLYSVITISSAVLVGVAAACFFAPWLFGNTTLTATGITLIGAYYAIFAIFAPFILFCSCIHGCSKFNRKLFDERENNRFNAADIDMRSFSENSVDILPDRHFFFAGSVDNHCFDCSKFCF